MQRVAEPDGQRVGQPARCPEGLHRGLEDWHVGRDGLPGLVEGPDWTALEARQEESVGQRLCVRVREVVRLHVGHEAATVEVPQPTQGLAVRLIGLQERPDGVAQEGGATSQPVGELLRRGRLRRGGRQERREQTAELAQHRLGDGMVARRQPTWRLDQRHIESSDIGAEQGETDEIGDQEIVEALPVRDTCSLSRARAKALAVPTGFVSP